MQVCNCCLITNLLLLIYAISSTDINCDLFAALHLQPSAARSLCAEVATTHGMDQDMIGTLAADHSETDVMIKNGSANGEVDDFSNINNLSHGSGQVQVI